MGHTIKAQVVTIAAVVMLAASMVPQGWAQPSSPELAKFFTQYFEERLKDEPEFATTIGRHEYDDRWSDLSKAGRDQRRAHLQSRYEAAQKWSTENLSREDRLSLEVLRYDLQTQLDALDLETYLLRVGQLFGMHNRVYHGGRSYAAFTVKDCENTIARMHATPAYVDQNIAIMDEAIARGLTQPKIVADLVIEQLPAQSAGCPDTPLLEFLKKMPGRFRRRSGRVCGSRRPTLSRTIFFRPGEAAALHADDLFAQVRRRWDRESCGWRGSLRDSDPAADHDEHDAGGNSPHRRGRSEPDRSEMLAIARQTGFRDR